MRHPNVPNILRHEWITGEVGREGSLEVSWRQALAERENQERPKGQEERPGRKWSLVQLTLPGPDEQPGEAKHRNANEQGVLVNED